MSKPLILSTVELPSHLISELSNYCEVLTINDLERTNDLMGTMSRVEIIIGWEIDPELLRTAKNLMFIQCLTAGVDHLPWESIPDHVMVCSNAGSNADTTAEHALALLLAAVKRLHNYVSRVKAGLFDRPFEYDVLNGKEICVLGLGSIGRRVAIAAKSLGMRVYGVNRSGKTDLDIDGVYTTEKIDDSLRGRDYAVICLPLTKKTAGIITYDRLRLLRRNGVLVNVARAEIVVKEDLKRFLIENEEFIYASDVWWSRDDFSRDMDVISLPNVIATPWTAGAFANRNTWLRMIEYGVKNVIRYLSGERPMNIVDHSDYK